ncbi:hypothetical protein LCGC14_1884910 [marine sediment metagenome]|uniref:Uncharacterized protein n=1 Tax=marine sediment metagenome TaxID=412755 RepID=A0A0F9IZG9_9ZZZZ
MGRNRIIRSGFWDDQKLTIVSRDARLTYIGMWTHSDDFGVVRGNPAWLRSRIYPNETITLGVFKKWLEELEKIKRIWRYMVQGELYYYIPTFLDHQKIDRPNVTSRNPVPPKGVIDAATNHRRAFDESSEMPRTEGKGKERKGKEVKGKEEKGSKGDTLPPELNELPLFLVDEKLIQRWPDLLISWKKTYPKLDVMSQIAQAHNNLVEHPEKHYRNMVKFIGDWIKRTARWAKDDTNHAQLSREAKIKRLREATK